MNVLEGGLATSDNAKEIAAKYREKIIGKTCLTSVPQEYWDISVVVESKGFSLEQWYGFSLDDRAKILAHHYLKNMVEVIDAHYKEQEEAKERIGKKGG